jgi:hypothetical protein
MNVQAPRPPLVGPHNLGWTEKEIVAQDTRFSCHGGNRPGVCETSIQEARGACRSLGDVPVLEGKVHTGMGSPLPCAEWSAKHCCGVKSFDRRLTSPMFKLSALLLGDCPSNLSIITIMKDHQSPPSSWGCEPIT